MLLRPNTVTCSLNIRFELFRAKMETGFNPVRSRHCNGGVYMDEYVIEISREGGSVRFDPWARKHACDTVPAGRRNPSRKEYAEKTVCALSTDFFIPGRFWFPLSFGAVVYGYNVICYLEGEDNDTHQCEEPRIGHHTDVCDDFYGGCRTGRIIRRTDSGSGAGEISTLPCVHLYRPTLPK